jgi:hypothetical protein
MLTEEGVKAVTTSIEVVDEVFRITTVVSEVISAPINPNQTTWIFDTGATDHFTPDLNNIPDNKAYTDSQLVSVGNGHQLSISHIGNAQL